MQPFDEAMDSITIAAQFAVAQGFGVKITKVRRGAPGFINWGPVMAQCIAEGDTHLFAAADDVLLPHDAIVRLVNDDKDIVNGIYRKNTIYQLTPANYCETWDSFMEKFKAGGLHETQYAAAHSLCIKTSVFEKMNADYPELAYQEDGQLQTEALLL